MEGVESQAAVDCDTCVKSKYRGSSYTFVKTLLLWEGKREGCKIDGKILFSDLKYLRVFFFS